MIIYDAAPAAIAKQFAAVDDGRILAAVMHLIDALPEDANLRITIDRDRGRDDAHVELALPPLGDLSVSGIGTYRLQWHEQAKGLYLAPTEMRITTRPFVLDP